ncbi:hypothetical protein R6Q59_007679 [Mikania micrantha]
MLMPETGVLIANKFNVIVHSISVDERHSTTFFPLWISSTTAIPNQVVSLCHVNGNHYITLQLTGNYPIPTVCYYCKHFGTYNAAWESIYMNRIQMYNNLTSSSQSVQRTSRAGGSRRRGQSPTPPGSPGGDPDIADIIDTHPFLQFPHRTNAYRRLGRLITRPIEVPRAIDWDVLRLLGEYQRAVTIIGVDTPWRRFFDGGFLSAYREITYEFFCTFQFVQPQTSGPRQHPGQVQFRLGGELHRMTLPEFGVLLGLYT